MKQYFKVKENAYGNTDIKVTFDYDIGGMNYFTYRPIKRGYYCSITPVTREDKGTYSMESFSSDRAGQRILLKEVTRKSAKSEREAMEFFNDMLDAYLERFCKVYNLELA